MREDLYLYGYNLQKSVAGGSLMMSLLLILSAMQVPVWADRGQEDERMNSYGCNPTCRGFQPHVPSISEIA